MYAQTLIPKNDYPVTVESLTQELHDLGVESGMTMIVHSSLRTLGWVCGGAQAVILALESALGPEGTLVMPTHTSANSDPSLWVNPPVPESWWQTIRDTMPAFDVDLTPCRRMGAIPETFRKQRGVLRSNHPTVSFAAWGRDAEYITSNHSLDFGLGEQSPLAKVYELDGYVLLLGVGHDSNTSLHLAEYRSEVAQPISTGSAINVDGTRAWVPVADREVGTDEFDAVVGALRGPHPFCKRGRVAAADAMFMRQRAVVDFAVEWMGCKVDAPVNV